jgi:rhodanese-related sulfurtransferase
MPVVPELTPTEFCRRWDESARSDVVLLDVREPAEIEIATIAGTLQIPMGDVPQQLGQLGRDKPIVVMCHSGMRSRRVAEYLTSRGFADVFNLAGGIDAWSLEIDPQVPRY